MANVGHYRRDAAMTVSGTVKATAGDAFSDVLDLGEVDSQGLRSEDFELQITLPAITTTQFPANTGATFTLQSSDSATFASGVTNHRAASVTGGTAFDGETFRFKPSVVGDRYWRVKATTTLTGAGATGTGADKLTYKIEYLA